jgi:hypothetical protein
MIEEYFGPDDEPIPYQIECWQDRKTLLIRKICNTIFELQVLRADLERAQGKIDLLEEYNVT